MDIERINKLARDWDSITWKVIRFEKIDLKKLHRLFKETYEMIENYSTEKAVPKELCGLLWEMHEFSWWVGDLDDTPIHYLFEDIVTVVQGLNKYLLTRDADIETITSIIDNLNFDI